MAARRPSASLASAVILLAACAPALAQSSSRRPLRGEQKLQLEAMYELVDEVAAQKRSAPADVALSWQSHFFKSVNGLVYVPYTVGIDGRFDRLPVGMYVRVLRKDAVQSYFDGSKQTTMRTWLNLAASPTQLDPKDIRSGNVEGTAATAEDIRFFEPPKDGRLRRAIWLPPGDYDVYVAMRERPGGKTLPKVVVLKQPLTVPDLSKQFAMSSIILADSVEPTTRALNQEQQADDPYSLGGTKIVPAATSRYRTTGELLIVFYVYNPAAGPDGKPDIQVSYTFLQKAGDVERLFTATPDQQFAAGTLPPEFSLAAGHQLMAGQSVPLESFPPGEYRLQVAVTDNLSHATTGGDLSFSVAGQ